MIKSAMRSRVKEVAEVTGNSRWSTDYIDRTIGRVHTAGWKRILNANNTYRSASRSPSLSSTGTVALSSLSSGSGDSLERIYRILGVRIGNAVYREVAARDLILQNGADVTGESRAYYVANETLYIPNGANQTAVVWVNHTPTPFHDLSLDSVSVTWPEDYEDALIYTAAAEVLSMAALEIGPADDLRRLASSMWADLMADVQRRTVNPLRMEYGDNAAEYGGF